MHIKEIEVVNKLLAVKQNLLEAKHNLKSTLNNSITNVTGNLLHNLRWKISSSIDAVDELSNVSITEYPTELDVMGSIKAMFILHYSYYFNMTAAVYDGKLCYQDHNAINREFQAYEKFNLMDVMLLADKALDNQDYALAIDLTRDIIKMMDEYKGILSTIDTKILLKKVEWLKKNLMKANNEYLTKNKSFIGKEHRTLTYLVDKNLKRKKKQPTFVANIDIYKVNHY